MGCTETLNALTDKEKKLLKTVFLSTQIQRTTLQKESGLKSANYYNTIDSLLDKKLIAISNSPILGQKGRPSQFLHLNSDFGFYLCIYFAKYVCVCSIMAFDKTEVAKASFEVNATLTAEQFEARLTSTCNRLFSDNSISAENIIACGLISGISFSKSGVMVAPFFEDSSWKTASIFDMINKIAPMHVTKESIANSATYEMYYGHFMKETPSLLFFLLSDGIGNAIVYNGKLLQLKPVPPASIEHWIVNPNGRQCACGRRGCVATSVGVNNIIDNTRAELQKGVPSMLSIKADSLSIQDISDAAEQGDALALSIVTEAVDTLNIGINNFLTLIDTDYIVVGGKLIDGCPVFYNMLEKTLRQANVGIHLIKGTEHIKSTNKGIITKIFFELTDTDL